MLNNGDVTKSLVMHKSFRHKIRLFIIFFNYIRMPNFLPALLGAKRGSRV